MTAEEWLCSMFSVLALSLIAAWICNNRRLIVLSWRMPGPVALPPIGNALQLGVFDINQMHVNLENLKKIYGDVYRVWFGPELCVVFSEAEDFEFILQNKIAARKGPKYDVITGISGPGLLTASGPYWRNHRHILNPAYNSDNLRNHIKSHNRHAELMAKGMLADALAEKNHDISVYFLRYSVGTIAEYVYGIKEDYHTGQFDEVTHVVPRIVECFYWRMCRPWYFCDFLYDLTAAGKMTRQLIDLQYNHFHVRLLRMHEEFVKRIANEGKDVVLSENNNKRLRTPFQVMLDVHAEGKMSKEEILSECNAMYFPGVDSLYSLMSFFLLMMAMHKKCQEKVRREIHDVMADDGVYGDVLPEHLPKFKYLDMCIKETNRLFPTGTSLMRSLEEDLHVKHRDLVIPVGTTILMSVYILNRNPKYWETPEVFIPERFLPEVAEKRPNFSHVPFSAGLRNCIGKTFGMDAAKISAVHLIRMMDFSSDLKMTDLRYKCDISIRSAIGYPMHIRKINDDIRL